MKTPPNDRKREGRTAARASSLPATAASLPSGRAPLAEKSRPSAALLVVAAGALAGHGLTSPGDAREAQIISAAPAIKTSHDGKRLMWLAERATVVVDPSLAGLAPAAYDATVRGFGAWLGTGFWMPELTFEESSQPLGAPAYDGRNTVSYRVIDVPGHERDVAYTLSYVDADTGEIREADIVLNARYAFDVFADARAGVGSGDSCNHGGQEQRACERGYDVQNVVAHEAGHFFGLGEDTERASATMFACTGRCEIHKRELELSDARAMDELYGGDRVVVTKGAGCALAGTAGAGPGWFLCLASVICGLLRRRTAR